MEQDFYRERLLKRHRLQVLIPGAAERDFVHRVIYDELCVGKIVDATRRHAEAAAAWALAAA